MTLGITATTIPQDFGSVGSQWYYSGHNAAPPAYAGYIRFNSIGDTLINAKLSHDLLQSTYNYSGDIVEETHHYVYEESDTIFMYSVAQSKFTVFYIFNRIQGDTLTLDTPDESLLWIGPTYRIVIDTVSNVIIDGVPLKKYTTTSLGDYSLKSVYMDRIGRLNWFFPSLGVSIPEGPGNIRCFADVQVDTNFQVYACDYRLSSAIYSTDDKSEFRVYPNPSTDDLMIAWNQPVESIYLFDLAGRLMLTSTNSTMIDLASLPKGGYQLMVRLKSGQSITRKIMKH